MKDRAKMARLVWLSLAVLCTLFIWRNSLQIAVVSDGRSGRVVELLRPVLDLLRVPPDFRSHLIRKLAHMTEFAILALCWVRVLHSPRRPLKKAAFTTMIPVALTAASDEIIQLFVPGRAGMLRDVLIDCAGGILMLCAYAIVLRLMHPKKKEKS